MAVVRAAPQSEAVKQSDVEENPSGLRSGEERLIRCGSCGSPNVSEEWFVIRDGDQAPGETAGFAFYCPVCASRLTVTNEP
jgi:RNA polymerase subunit RPABC4/transcription elongation factor Spt4